MSPVEAGMGMVGQIMCVEQCTFWMLSVALLGPHAPDSTGGADSAPTFPLSGFKGAYTLRPLLLRGEEGREGEGIEGRGQGAPK